MSTIATLSRASDPLTRAPGRIEASRRRSPCARILLGAAIGIAIFALDAGSSAEEAATAQLNGQLDGLWRLERRENLEAYEEATGASWLRRRLSNLASGMTQEIHQTGDRFQITLRVAHKTTLLDLVADGHSVTHAEMPSGESVAAVATVAGDVLTVKLTGPEGPRRIDRQLRGKQLIMTMTHLVAKVSTTWIFDPVETPDPSEKR
jgi:hypothetical protein